MPDQLDKLMGATTLFLVGAYGRTANKEDWLKGKDFQVVNGPYCSVRDVDRIRQDGWTRIVFLSKTGDPVYEEKL